MTRGPVIPLKIYTQPAQRSVPRPLYFGQIISRLRTRSWYTTTASEEPYLYYRLAWNPAFKWRFHDVQGDIKLVGAFSKIAHYDEIKGTCIVFSKPFIAADYFKVKEIGTEYDPRTTY